MVLDLEEHVCQPDTDERRKILNWISRRNYWTNQSDYFGRAEEGTGQWLLDSLEYKNWLEGGKRFLWCHGERKSQYLAGLIVLQPGSEKPFSGLFELVRLLNLRSSIVVDHLQKNFNGVDDVALACVYFNHKEDTIPTDIIGTLLKQLLERNSNMSDEARALYAAHKKRQTRPNLKELLQLLRTEASRISTVFIVLDALDEFSDTKNARATILLELRQISTVRVMITGRPHVENTVLSKLDDVSTTLIRASDNDIRKYLDTQIEKSGFLLQKMTADPSFRATLIDQIVGNADGM